MTNTLTIVLATLVLGLLIITLALTKGGTDLLARVTAQPTAVAAGNSTSTARSKIASEELWERALLAGRMEKELVVYGNLLANMLGVATWGLYGCAVVSGVLSLTEGNSSIKI